MDPTSGGAPGGGSGAIYNDGADYDTLIHRGQHHEQQHGARGGGAYLSVVDSGSGGLTSDH